MVLCDAAVEEAEAEADDADEEADAELVDAEADDADADEAADEAADDADPDENTALAAAFALSSSAFFCPVHVNARAAMIAAITTSTMTMMAIRLPLPLGACWNSRAGRMPTAESEPATSFSVRRSPSIEICMVPHLMQ